MKATQTFYILIWANKAKATHEGSPIKDLFVFSCYTGLAYVDVMKLAPQNLAIGIDGESWIITHRQKTEESVKVSLLSVALEIVQK